MYRKNFFLKKWLWERREEKLDLYRLKKEYEKEQNENNWKNSRNFREKKI
jgi:hypothetical protein